MTGCVVSNHYGRSLAYPVVVPPNSETKEHTNPQEHHNLPEASKADGLSADVAYPGSRSSKEPAALSPRAHPAEAPSASVQARIPHGGGSTRDGTSAPPEGCVEGSEMCSASDPKQRLECKDNRYVEGIPCPDRFVYPSTTRDPSACLLCY